MKKLNKCSSVIGMLALCFFMSCGGSGETKVKSNTGTSSSADLSNCEKVNSKGIVAVEASITTDDIYSIKLNKDNKGLVTKYNTTSKKWDAISKQGYSNLSIGANGTLYAIMDTKSKSGLVASHVVDKKWKTFSGKDFVSVSANSTSEIFALRAKSKGTKKNLQKYNVTTKKWETIVAVDASKVVSDGTNLYVLRNLAKKSGVISKRVGDKWENVKGDGFSDFDVFKGVFYGIKKVKEKNILYKLENNKWLKQGNQDIKQYSAGLNSSILLSTRTNGQVKVQICK